MLEDYLPLVWPCTKGGIRGGAFGLFIGILQDALVIDLGIFFTHLYGLRPAAGISVTICSEKALTACLWSLVITSLTTLVYFVLFFLWTGRAGIRTMEDCSSRNFIFDNSCPVYFR